MSIFIWILTVLKIFHKKSLNLGNIIKKNKAQFTSPLDEVVPKLWGYASSHGRHMGEGTAPTFAEAQFILYTTSAVIIFLKETFQPNDDDTI